MKNVILVHGWAADSRIWEKQREALEGRANVWIPDLPVWEAAWLQEKLGDFDPADTILVGWSLGGMLALEACAAGFRPRALLTIAACASFCRRPDYGVGVAAGGSPGHAAAVANRACRRWCTISSASFWRQGNGSGRTIWRRCCPRVRTCRTCPRDWSICRHGTSGRCCPGSRQESLTIVHGERDRITTAAQAYVLQEQLPGAHLVMLPGTGHVPMVSRSRELNDLIADFL